MSMKVIYQGKPLTLRDADFVASGGQGRVYARDDLAFKVFTHRPAVPSLDKLRELAVVQRPEVIAPTAPLHDEAGAICGYAMPRVRDAVSWAQLCTPALRARMRFDDAAALRLIAALRDTLIDVHRLGLAVVDLSENNVLIQAGAPRIIDVDSWQTPSHPATALTPSIACPRVRGNKFGAHADWFAFGVLTFMLLVGVHPFKGKHPSIKGLAARMKAGLSVLDPVVRVPAMCRLGSIPDPLRDWYSRVFATDHRAPPPRCTTTVAPARARKARKRAQQFPAPIEHLHIDRGRVFVATAFAAYENNDAWHRSNACIVAQGVAPCGEPFIVERDASGALQVVLRGANAGALNARVEAMTSAGPQVFVKVGTRVDALHVVGLGKATVPSLRTVANVLPRATTLFPGACVQDLLGRRVASWLGHPRGAPQVALPALDGHSIVDARREGDRFVALTSRSARLTAHTFELHPDGSVADVSQRQDVDPTATTFVAHGNRYVAVGPQNGVYLARTSLLASARTIDDTAPHHLASDGTTLALARGVTLNRQPVMR